MDTEENLKRVLAEQGLDLPLPPEPSDPDEGEFPLTLL